MRKTTILIATIFIFCSCGTAKAQTFQLWGMTSAGGANNVGVLFQYNPSTNIYTKELDFDGVTNGSTPTGSLMQASDGNLYGMTEQGGANNLGVLFQYNPLTHTYTKELDFDGATNGSNPYGSLMQASDGNLYGMTEQGGANNDGVLFRYNPSTNTYTKILDFDSINGSNPYSSLMQASNGNLYGMTATGGVYNGGVLFQYNSLTNTYTKEFDFDGAFNYQSFPMGYLIQTSDGNLYGMTNGAGANQDGVLFQYNPSTNTYTKMLDFNGANGQFPNGSLMQASNGNFYGTTWLGGANNIGVLFRYNPSTNIYTKELDFDRLTNGFRPACSLIQASDGNLYGMAFAGGANDYGLLFQFNPSTNTFTKMLDFNGANGQFPVYTNLIEIIPLTISTASLNTNTCMGGSISVSYTISGAYDASNIFTAQLSNAAGSFVSPVNIGSIASTNAGSISAIIPAITAGSAYKIRVVSSNPVNIGSSVTVISAPIINLGRDTTLCQGQAVILNGGIASAYLWSNGSTAASINASTVGTYWLQASNGQCTVRDSILISINQYPIPNLGKDTTLCEGQTVTINSGSANQYLWSNGTITSSINVSNAGTYWLQASNGQCNVRDSILISINQYPIPNLGKDTTLCEGQTVTLKGGSALSYLWSNGSTNSSITITAPGTYWLQANNKQCIAGDSIVLSFDNCETEITIPNVFTPNNDGVNDVFTITTKNIIMLNCRLYNRWGILISELKNTNDSWDGTTTSGLQCTPSVFYCIVEYTDSQGTSNVKKEFVQLLR